MLIAILCKQGFSENLCRYFEDYLQNRQTQFLFNEFLLNPMDFSTGIGQGSSLSPILTGCYIAPILHCITPILKTIRVVDDDGDKVFLSSPWSAKDVKSNGNVTLQFFVDDGLIHCAGKLNKDAEDEDQLKYNNLIIRRVFESFTREIRRLGLIQESDKLELMHFIRKRKGCTPTWSQNKLLGPQLRAFENGCEVIVKPKAVMRYLEFYLDPQLTFREHIRFYATKACSTMVAL